MVNQYEGGCEKKKLVIVTTVPMSFSFFKGLLRFLSEYFNVCIVSSERVQLERIAANEGVKSHYIPIKRPIFLVKDFISLLHFIIFLCKYRPSIVHGNTPKGGLLSMISSYICRVPVRIYMCHGLRYQGETGWMKWLLQKTETLSCSCATKVICVSYGVKQKLINDKICDRKKAVVVNNGSPAGIDVEYYDPKETSKARANMREILNIPHDAFTFIYVGRIVSDKGIDELVAAFVKLNKIYKSIYLILVGEEEPDIDPLSINSIDEIKNHPHICTVGYQIDVRPYLACADAFVFPSHREGFGMSLIEAGAMGLPCISADIIGCNEIIISGINGELVPSKNTNALFCCMKRWVENPKMIADMASNARRLVIDRYNQPDMWNALKDEYMAVLK